LASSSSVAETRAYSMRDRDFGANSLSTASRRSSISPRSVFRRSSAAWYRETCRSAGRGQFFASCTNSPIASNMCSFDGYVRAGMFTAALATTRAHFASRFATSSPHTRLTAYCACQSRSATMPSKQRLAATSTAARHPTALNVVHTARLTLDIGLLLLRAH
jgi:hypothetical protein